MKSVNILISSVGHRAYLVDYFKRAMAKTCSGLVHAVNSCHTAALHRADKWSIAPEIASGKYVQFILGYCLENNISGIIPLLDLDVRVLAEHAPLFANNGVIVVAPPLESIEICRDKYIQSLWLRKRGFFAPQTFLSIEHALSDGNIQFPLVIKPRWGCASRGVYKCFDEEELMVCYHRCRRDIEDSFIYVESCFNHTESSNVIVQECISGKELGLQTISDLNGTFISSFLLEKIEMRAGETWIAQMLSQSFSGASSLAEMLQSKGIMDIDIIENERGQQYIIDINPRFGGQYPFAHLAGADIPQQIVRWLMNEETDIRLSAEIVPGLIMEKNILPSIISENKYK